MARVPSGHPNGLPNRLPNGLLGRALAGDAQADGLKRALRARAQFHRQAVLAETINTLDSTRAHMNTWAPHAHVLHPVQAPSVHSGIR